MKFNTHLQAVLVFTTTLLPAVAMAQPDMRSPSQLLEELTASFANAREAEAALKANLAQKDAFLREREEINRENAAYKRESADYASDLASHNTEIDKFNAECGSGTFTREELARCEAREQALQSTGQALETRRSQLEAQRLAVKQRTDAFNQKERARAQAAEALLSRYDEANANINAIIDRLTSEQRFSHCAGRPSPEAVQQCIELAYRGSR